MKSPGEKMVMSKNQYFWVTSPIIKPMPFSISYKKNGIGEMAMSVVITTIKIDNEKTSDVHLPQVSRLAFSLNKLVGNNWWCPWIISPICYIMYRD